MSQIGFHIGAVNHLIAFQFALVAPLAWHLMASRRRSRDNSFFGVRVQPGFAESETGRAVFRQFRARLWWSALVFAGLVLPLPFPFSVGIAVLFSGMPGWALFARAHRRVQREAEVQPVPALRVASPMAEGEPLNRWLDALDWLCIIVPPALPITALALVLSRRSPGAEVDFDILFSFCLGLTCAATQWALRFRARSSDWASTPDASCRFRTYLGLMCTLAFISPISGICFFVATAGRKIDMAVFFGITWAWLALAVFLVWRLRFWLSKHLDRQSMDPMSDACWKWGFCYSNQADAALVVPLRTGVGFSYNFAHLGVRMGTVVLTAVLVVSLVISTSGLAGIH